MHRPSPAAHTRTLTHLWLETHVKHPVGLVEY
jgi:hypothetical protein